MAAGDLAEPWWDAATQTWVMRLCDQIACDKDGQPRRWHVGRDALAHAISVNRSTDRVSGAGDLDGTVDSEWD
jgi:hypothetical protein